MFRRLQSAHRPEPSSGGVDHWQEQGRAHALRSFILITPSFASNSTRSAQQGDSIPKNRQDLLLKTSRHVHLPITVDKHIDFTAHSELVEVNPRLDGEARPP